MSQTPEGKNRPSGARIALFIFAGALAVLGIVLAIAMQSLIPLVCVVFGLALPLIPVGSRSR